MDDFRLFQEIRNRMDPDEVLDVLGLTTMELVSLLAEEILDRKKRFEDFLEYDDE